MGTAKVTGLLFLEVKANLDFSREWARGKCDYTLQSDVFAKVSRAWDWAQHLIEFGERKAKI